MSAVDGRVGYLFECDGGRFYSCVYVFVFSVAVALCGCWGVMWREVFLIWLNEGKEYRLHGALHFVNYFPLLPDNLCDISPLQAAIVPWLGHKADPRRGICCVSC